ncbi:MAG: HAD hydrolase-like protein [Desulfobacterales bacterium]|nr:MAG: HAD hydrolase-like protein [Desulfobacterales bacterium]
MMVNNIIFDLDGTLVESGSGILNSIRYTIKKLGFQADLEQDLRWAVGPPLEHVMIRLLSGYSKTEIRKAVSVHRDHYNSKGLQETVLYPGVVQTLTEIRTLGKKMFIGTSKPRDTAVVVCERLKIKHFFQEIYGRSLDVKEHDKTDLIKLLISSEAIKPKETVVVGDRKHDIDAAHNNGLTTIGVTYGYGTRSELIQSGADALCDKPEQILHFV